MAPGLRQHALARVDQDHRQVRGRGAGDHVARVLLVAGGVGDDELAPLGGEEAVGDVDGDALLALGRQAVDQQGEVDVAALRARPASSRPRAPPAGRRRASCESYSSRPISVRLAVVDAAAGDEAQQVLCSCAQVGVDVAAIRSRACAIRSSPPASSSPSRPTGRGRSPGPAARRSWSSSISWMISGSVVAVALDRAGQRIAAERAEAHRPHLRLLAGRSGKRSSSTMISAPSRSTTGRSSAKYSGTIGMFSQVDVVPDVELGPVGEREDADALALVRARVVELPQLGPLALRIPAMLGRAEREDPLLGPRLLLVAPRAAEGGVEAVLVERLLQRLRSSSRRCAGPSRA